jgi:hypothetical protein
MNTQPGQCAYVVAYLDREPVSKRILFRREAHFTWETDAPRRPFKVHVFDNSGRRVMTAQVRNYREIDPADVEPAPAKPSVMPTEIDIAWSVPSSKAGGRISLVLSEMTTKRKWQVSACRMPDPGDLPEDRVIQVDKDIAVPGGGGK